MKKLLLSMFLLPILAHANQVNLDNLVSNSNNFCNQGQDGKLTGVLSYFNLNNDSDIYFKGFKVSRIEIQNPIVQTQFTPSQIQEESKKYIKQFSPYQYKNLYTINYVISLVIDGSLENVKSKIENFNGTNSYKKFGQYNPDILTHSKNPEEFENNLKTIQVPEYNASFMNNYETQNPRTNMVYQCKMISYTNENVATITYKASH